MRTRIAIPQSYTCCLIGRNIVSIILYGASDFAALALVISLNFLLFTRTYHRSPCFLLFLRMEESTCSVAAKTNVAVHILATAHRISNKVMHVSFGFDKFARLVHSNHPLHAMRWDYPNWCSVLNVG